MLGLLLGLGIDFGSLTGAVLGTDSRASTVLTAGEDACCRKRWVTAGGGSRSGAGLTTGADTGSRNGLGISGTDSGSNDIFTAGAEAGCRNR